MRDIGKQLSVFADKYKESKYNLSVFTDEEIILYGELLDDVIDNLVIVNQKIKDEKYQRVIDKFHEGV